jgi:ACS family hexuronate transporter-like MFS transporter
VGGVLEKNPDNYLPVFIIAGSIYLIALIIIQVLVPKLEQAHVE